jgi:hypothetical protein
MRKIKTSHLYKQYVKKSIELDYNKYNCVICNSYYGDIWELNGDK